MKELIWPLFGLIFFAALYLLAVFCGVVAAADGDDDEPPHLNAS